MACLLQTARHYEMYITRRSKWSLSSCGAEPSARPFTVGANQMNVKLTRSMSSRAKPVRGVGDILEKVMLVPEVRQQERVFVGRTNFFLMRLMLYATILFLVTPAKGTTHHFVRMPINQSLMGPSSAPLAIPRNCATSQSK